MLSLWDPFADLNRFQRDVERNFAGGRKANQTVDFAPAVDVHEDKEAFVLRAELPGLKREEIEVSLDENVLTLKGERKLEKEEQGRRYHRIERSYGSFVRYFQLPKALDADRVEANLADGVLTVKVPKKEVLKARKIDVQS